MRPLEIIPLGVLAWFVTAVLFGVITATAASARGRDIAAWFILGGVLGPFGLVWVLVARKNQAALDLASTRDGTLKRCPHCAELIQSEARVCRHCNRDLISATRKEVGGIVVKE